MNTSYAICMAFSAAVCLICLFFRLKKRGMRAGTAFAALPIAAVLAAVLAKVFYLTLMFHRSLAIGGQRFIDVVLNQELHHLSLLPLIHIIFSVQIYS